MFTTTKILTERSVLLFEDYTMNQLNLPLQSYRTINRFRMHPEMKE